ncbi:MAG: YbhB/YbcL family Raf kinase inhibitor-like protein [Deltaproteobacteria bacterium]|jgi:Raf kinase inhibitor-like YbhB/YbcL family protein|nr:YbhB/YbcL family Raf kinase inhibitor-like protein [Deltaproteobacteria bacterium]
MKLRSNSFEHGDFLPAEFAFGKTSAEGKIDLSDNKSPHLAWDDLPEGTRSVAILCIDRDVPTKPDDVNQEGRMVPSDLPRAEFSHWVLVDLAPDATIEEGAFSDGITAKGKAGPEGPQGTRQGINDYTGWFAGDPDMAGDYYGYDGPCPPFNDSIVHHYYFTAYALDLDRVAVDGKFTAADVKAAIDGHVLGEATLMAKYKINQSAVEL